jgi:hypothetical protein
MGQFAFDPPAVGRCQSDQVRAALVDRCEREVVRDAIREHTVDEPRRGGRGGERADGEVDLSESEGKKAERAKTSETATPRVSEGSLAGDAMVENSESPSRLSAAMRSLSSFRDTVP